ncbi:CRP/FNR family transcriptional regulator, anaerobic regulatory protein [Candidatus Kryptonium thompsonii]|jgi:CRP-like cAMP-binding protein|uniref:CRP/FNR family transcriptional regulator, anaerobic regulatory protein n=2 Tax=Candidatus Kryptonium thompsonii TaxID=1633631 RepID=A0A0P1MII5_9BACT|nr:Crp/Fnr family transcriptional regulator [Candidatus Kryptonium thompsoni]CUS82486.1 CRP/FNR family transcriptional regulator, anaerobic regulatory protein [Candidatus Kryptonium thompsoni]CUS94948.1 CRP/FNR family transcriptional regulator, anaerobic regulatory protein [Candidatus Kryptonium thompsoni]CUU02598.1 CRP/FNR family transcriptional regulator, anaerobic regulatory protein [Candidatus Kryptonium thompsoni]
MVEDINFLRNVSIFEELPERDLARIASLGTRKIFSKGSVILMEDEIGSALFIIIDGKVKVSRLDETGKEVILSILGPGEVFGEMSLLDGMKRSATVSALTDTEVLIIYRDDFLNLLNKHPQIAISLLKELTQRLRKADMQIKSLSLKDAQGRVGCVLIMLADDLGKMYKGHVIVEGLPTQQDLANMAGTSRETVSRILSKFEKMGLIKIEGRNLIILEYEKMKRMFK